VSVFNPERVVEIVPHVDFLKIASAECLWTELIDACAKTGTPLFISSGGCTIDQIGELAALCKKGIDDGRFISKITLFFCEAAYPASHLTWERGKAVAGIAKQFGLGFGVSDHSMDVMPFMNAPYFEKHMNLVGATDTDDAAHSLNLEQAKSFCKAAKDGLAAALQFPAPTEITFREKHARRQIGEGTYRPIP
jgi:N-acetylneuraminate synthase